MTGASGTIATAKDRLGGLQERLEGLNGRLQAAATMSQDSDADNKFESFRSRWKDEFGIIADMLGKFQGALTSASEAYGGVDMEIANSIRPPGQGPAAQA